MKRIEPNYPSDLHENFNPLLYFPQFVKKPVKPSRKGELIAKDQAFFAVTRNMIAEAKENIPLFGTSDFIDEQPARIARTIQAWISKRIVYDDYRTYRGIRSSVGTFQDKRGHCLEKGLLYCALLKHCGINPKWHIAAHAIGFKFDGPFDSAAHPFLEIGKSSEKYFADTGYGPIQRKSLDGIASTYNTLSDNEMISVCLGSAAEDFALSKKASPETELSIRDAIEVDPNNYTNRISLAEILAMRGERKRAKLQFDIARRIAPRCADIDKARGDFMTFYEDDNDTAIESYQRALTKSTEDPFLVLDMARRLRILGKKKDAREAEAKFIGVAEKRNIAGYLGVLIKHEDYMFPDSLRHQKHKRQEALYRDFEPAFNLLYPEANNAADVRLMLGLK